MPPLRPQRQDDDIELDLEPVVVDDEVPVLDEVEPLPRFVTAPVVVTVLELVGTTPTAALAAALAAIVDVVRETDVGFPAPIEGEAPRSPTPTDVAARAGLVTLVTAATADEVGVVLARHGRLAAAAIVAGLEARLALRGATAWGELAIGDGLAVGAPLIEALQWRCQDDWIGVRLAPSARLALASVGGAAEGWTPDGALRWTEDVRAAERALASLGPLLPHDLERIERTLGFLRA